MTFLIKICFFFYCYVQGPIKNNTDYRHNWLWGPLPRRLAFLWLIVSCLKAINHVILPDPSTPFPFRTIFSRSPVFTYNYQVIGNLKKKKTCSSTWYMDQKNLTHLSMNTRQISELSIKGYILQLMSLTAMFRAVNVSISSYIYTLKIQNLCLTSFLRR